MCENNLYIFVPGDPLTYRPQIIFIPWFTKLEVSSKKSEAWDGRTAGRTDRRWTDGRGTTLNAAPMYEWPDNNVVHVHDTDCAFAARC